MKRKLSWTIESVTFSIVEKWIKKKKRIYNESGNSCTR